MRAHQHYIVMELNFLLDLIFPKSCVGCRKYGKYFCDRCFSKIEFFETQVCPYCERQSPYGLTHFRCLKKYGLDGMFVLAHYRGPIRQALKKIKYRGTHDISRELAEIVAKNYHGKFEFDSFIPIPLSKERELKRGFNQAEKLAVSLSKTSLSLRKPVLNILRRTRETKPQFDLKYNERQENVKGAFTLNSNFKFQISNSSACLVDDVATTGSTIFECAKVLKKAGASKVWAICVARGG